MVIRKEGDTTTGPCYSCKGVATATFRYAPLMHNEMEIPDILQGFCDTCGDVVSIPHQSTFRIREFRETYNHSIEFRVPGHYIDILVAIGMTHKISQKPNLLCRIVSELYLKKLKSSQGGRVRKRVLAGMNDELATGKNRGRLSCLFPDAAFMTLKTVSTEERKTVTDIVKGIIVAAKHDLLDGNDLRLGHEFDALATMRL